MEWYYGYVPASGSSPECPLDACLIGPSPGPLRSAEARLTTPSGKVVSRWRVKGDIFRLETEIQKESGHGVMPSVP